MNNKFIRLFNILLASTLFLLLSHEALAFKVGLVLDKGGKDDKSFNSAAYNGSKLAEKDFGIDLKYVEATDTNAFENLHRSFARKKFDLIIGIGFAQKDALEKIAQQFPEQKFALVDGEVDLPNVKSLMFEEHEGSFVVGVIAAAKSKTKKLGFIGGMDIPLIRRFETGFKAGVQHESPSAKIISNFIGITGEAWNNPAKAKELALSQINQGVDVIFVAAGASGSGVFDAVEEKKRFAIGVDSNQNWMKPGFILTSMLKRVDLAVYDTIQEAKLGSFKGGVVRFGLPSKGVDYALDQHNQKILTEDIKKKAEAAKAKIISGKVVVPDYYKQKKAN